MTTKAELRSFSKDQLVELIVARGKALVAGDEARNLLLQLFEADKLTSDDLNEFFLLTHDIMTTLAVSEEKILAGQSPQTRPN